MFRAKFQPATFRIQSCYRLNQLALWGKTKWGEHQDCLKAVRMEHAPDVSNGTALVLVVLNLWVAASGCKLTYINNQDMCWTVKEKQFVSQQRRKISQVWNFKTFPGAHPAMDSVGSKGLFHGVVHISCRSASLDVGTILMLLGLSLYSLRPSLLLPSLRYTTGVTQFTFVRLNCLFVVPCGLSS